ncbi:Hypothetical predicted protein [Podarcis lilfordi]|uniref:Uncharacterized protein n=1 Tax=Podarcis lilfordi TaxID=74358 RepID=A0AA35L459_9SAUR|nr:Hypothetical predicted protein [Podarcis lilfordi]
MLRAGKSFSPAPDTPTLSALPAMMSEGAQQSPGTPAVILEEGNWYCLSLLRSRFPPTTRVTKGAVAAGVDQAAMFGEGDVLALSGPPNQTLPF